MRVWRIYDREAAYALLPNFDPLDGQGAALYPGRWNKAGVRMVYTSQSPELAMLELLTKLNPAAFRVCLAVEIDVPADAWVQDAVPAMTTTPALYACPRHPRVTADLHVTGTASCTHFGRSLRRVETPTAEEAPLSNGTKEKCDGLGVVTARAANLTA